MASVGQRHRKSQAAPVLDHQVTVIRVETNAQRYQWLEEVDRRAADVGAGAVALALRLFLSWNSKDGFCFPSQETLARALGVSSKSASRYQKALERSGLLVVEKRKMRRSKHAHNIYFFALPDHLILRSKPMMENNKTIGDQTNAANDDVPETTREAPIDTSKLLNAEDDAVTRHESPLITGHQCPPNNVKEPITGGPPAPPLDSSISGLSDVAREVALARSSVDSDQLSFFDRLGPHQQRHFLTLSPDDREHFQLAYEVDDE